MATIQETFNKYLNGVYSDCFKNTNGTNYTRNYCDSFGKDMSSYFDCKKTTIHSLTKPVKFDAESLNVGGRFKTDTAFNIKDMKLTDKSISFIDKDEKYFSISVPVDLLEINNILTCLFNECLNDLDLEQYIDDNVIIEESTILRKFFQIKDNFSNVATIMNTLPIRAISDDVELSAEQLLDLGIYDLLSDDYLYNNFRIEYNNLKSGSGYDNRFTFDVHKWPETNQIYLENIVLNFTIFDERDFNSLFWLNNGQLVSNTGRKITKAENQQSYNNINDFEEIHINLYHYNDWDISESFESLIENSDTEILDKHGYSLYYGTYQNFINLSQSSEDIPTSQAKIEYHSESINFKDSLKNSENIVVGDVLETYNNSQTLSTAIVSSYNFIDTFTISSDNDDLYDLINTTLYR